MKGFIKVTELVGMHTLNRISINVNSIVEVSTYDNYENEERREHLTCISTVDRKEYLCIEAIGEVKARIDSASEGHIGLFERFKELWETCHDYHTDCEKCPFYEHKDYGRGCCDWHLVFGQQPASTEIWRLSEVVARWEGKEAKK